MNLSNTVSRIKMKLGLINITTPFENLNEVIVDILREFTIPDFSVYNPVKETLHINTHDLELADKDDICETYLLPDFKNRTLLYVFDVTYDTSLVSGLGYFGGGLPLIQGSLVNQAMLANAGASLMNTIIPKMSFEFIPPRTLKLYNAYSSSRLVIYLGFEHDKSMASIPETCRESFMQLALLDVKSNLYPTMKQYTELSTSIGNINLKIDDWANAEQERSDLIAKWDESYYLDIQNTYYS